MIMNILLEKDQPISTNKQNLCLIIMLKVVTQLELMLKPQLNKFGDKLKMLSKVKIMNLKCSPNYLIYNKKNDYEIIIKNLYYLIQLYI